MDAQTFLYWALAFGFILLVIFMCVAIFYVIRILRDVSDATASVKDTAETVNENVSEILDKVNSTADQVLNTFVKPFTMISFLAEKIKPFVDMMHPHEEEEEEEEEKPKKKRGRKRTTRKKK